MKRLFILLLLVSFSGFAQVDIKTNSPIVVDVLEEFADAVEFYQIDYQPTLKDIKQILLVDGNRDFISSFENGIIKINSRYESYPELLRIQVFQSLGILYGLKYTDVGRSYMSTVWREIHLQKELYAVRHNQRPYNKMYYMKALKEANPIKYKSI